jgi:hypothetical protein
MNLRFAVAALALLIAGCPSGPDPRQPPDIDLSNARRLEAEGKPLEAVVEHARLVDELTASGRSDARAHAAWARILASLHRLKAGERLAQASAETRMQCESLRDWCSTAGQGLTSTGAAGHWSKVLSLGSEPAVLAEAAGAIADLFEEKADVPALRRGRLEPAEGLSESLYRRSLIQASSDYARYAVSRAPGTAAKARAVRLLRRLAKELRDASSRTDALPVPKARWAEQADGAEAMAVALGSAQGGDPAVTNDLRREIESDTNALMQSATENLNKANDLLSRRADESEILDSLERALRHLVAARESLVEPSPNQKRALDVMSIAADALRHQAFQD